MLSKLILENGVRFSGESFGALKSVAGEVVFTTGMVGYPESLTDPSYRGQILVFTYPLIGNYGVPDPSEWESKKIHLAGIVVANYIDTPSHCRSQQSLGRWLKKQIVPGVMLKETRQITKMLREKGTLLGKIVRKDDIAFDDPDKRNLVAEVSCTDVSVMNPDGAVKKTIVLIDCGAKQNIERILLDQGCRVIRVPWNYDFLSHDQPYDGVFISNGPGDPKLVDVTIENVRQALEKDLPLFGICLGSQILALAAGGDTRKLKFGHRGQNQPAQLVGTKKCYLTSQNHSFEVHKIPNCFEPWFVNNNDGSNEGIRHKSKPVMAVQFHPEACPGPVDTAWVVKEWLS